MSSSTRSSKCGRGCRARRALVGTGVSLGEVRARVASWEPGAALLLGPRSPAEVAEWMGACDVMTLPSWAEGTPNVVLEALASGRPVVATRVGGIPDVLREGPGERGGIIVPPRDAGALALGLQAALEGAGGGGERWDEAAIRACGPGSWQRAPSASRACSRRAYMALPRRRHGRGGATSSERNAHR